MRRTIPAREEIVCDRCSANIAPQAYPQLQLRADMVEKTGTGDVGGFTQKYDLCPSCILAFEKFMLKV